MSTLKSTDATPAGLIRRYIELFNAQDVAGIVGCFALPHLRIYSGRSLTGQPVVRRQVITDPAECRIDFSGLVERGWSSTRIDEVSTIADDGNVALVRLLFTRLGANDTVIYRGDGCYTATRHDQAWRIAAMLLLDVAQGADVVAGR